MIAELIVSKGVSSVCDARKGQGFREGGGGRVCKDSKLPSKQPDHQCSSVRTLNMKKSKAPLLHLSN